MNYNKKHNKGVYNTNRLKKKLKMWVKLAGKSFPTKFEITTYDQYKACYGPTIVLEPENPQPDELMNDDVSIEAYEENDSDEEIAEINNCLKSNNEEKNDPIDQISNESKAAMVNECVEKLISPQVLAMNYNKKHNIRVGNINRLKRKLKMWIRLAGKSYPTKFEITTYDEYKACYGPTIVLTPENPQPDDVATESRNSMISSIKESIDFDKVSSLDPDTELLSYIKVVAHGYKDAISSSAPNGIQLVNDLIEDRTKYLPCGQFNKDNSCDLPFVHLNEKNENMIHSCALCYFVLSGLINVHLLRKCPLLSFI